VVDRLCTSSAEGGGRVRTADKAVPMALRRKRWGMGLSRNRFRRLRDAHGLTVVDLVIGVAVIAIMAAIAVPNLQPLLLRYRLNGATRQVMSDLMAARMKAVSQHRPFRIFFTESQTYTICDDANEDGTVDNGEGSASMRDLQATYAGVSVAATTNPVFTAKGMASSAATITLTNTQGTKSIAVARTGQVSIN
jgi:type IV fimbrial biogenesis protein FimT